MAEQIGHWINGRRVEGKSGRLGDVSPRRRRARPPGRFCQQRRDRRRRRRRGEGLSRLVGDAAAQPRPHPLQFRELVEKNADRIAALITAEHGKILSDAKGELTRGSRSSEFSTGIPACSFKGEFTEQVGRGVDSWSVRQAVGICAGITRQLPGLGADVDVPSGTRLRQLLRPETVGARPLDEPRPRRAPEGGRPPRRRLQRRPRRQGGGRRDPSSIPNIAA